MTAAMDFEGLRIEYDARVLEPRPWTALQSLWAVELLDAAPGAGSGPGSGVLELCAGAGHIGLLVAARSGRSLVAVDISPVACAFALGNAEAAGLADRVDVRCAPLEDAVGPGERFALVVADPPWVTSVGVQAYPDDPLLAIDGGPDGLRVARECLAVAERHLVGGGTVLIQLGTEEQCDLLAAEAGPGLVDAGRRRGERGWVLALRRPETR